jgi:hypothetical protein
MKPEYDFSRARRGPIAAPAPGKTRITIRLDEALLEWFRKRVHIARGGRTPEAGLRSPPGASLSRLGSAPFFRRISA